MEYLINILVSLVEAKHCSDGRIMRFANQGQALDGYSELAEYRGLIDNLSHMIEIDYTTVTSPRAYLTERFSELLKGEGIVLPDDVEKHGN